VGGDEPAELEEAVQGQVDAGFTAVKMNACGRLGPIASPAEIDRIVHRAAAARAVLGDSRDLAIDFHGRVSLANARRILPLLEPYRPMFVEEPVLPEERHQLRHVVAASSVPIATGERMYSRWDFRDILDSGLAVAQPDLSHAGGISEVRRIAAMAEVYGVTMAPHCPLGPIALAASLQIAFATPNFLIQEQSLGIHYNNAGNDLLDYLVDPSVFRFEEGHVRRPLGPGLGVEIDEKAVRRADELGHSWRSPLWRHADGAFAEW
jgi:galactonate dehydratase